MTVWRASLGWRGLTICLLLTYGGAACSSGGQPPPQGACGGAGSACCGGGTCDPGLTCSGDVCTSGAGPAPRDCARTKLVDARTTSPSAVALFFTADDCSGNPLTGLTSSDFTLKEDGLLLSPTEASARILQRDGVQVFVSLVLDFSASTSGFAQYIIDGAKALVTLLQVTNRLPVQIGIELFDGGPALVEWQEPTLDTTTLTARLDALVAYSSADPSSTNLNGAVITALSRITAAEAAFRARNLGGAFTTGHVVVFTDGRDTASLRSAAELAAAEAASPDQVVAIGLRSPDYDPVALASVAPYGVITAATPQELTPAFSRLAGRMAAQFTRTYLLGYCSPKRAGTHTVSVEVAGVANPSAASYTFSATGFGPGCSGATFSTMCAGKQCGGLGCGACYDPTDLCVASSLTCANRCTLGYRDCDGASFNGCERLVMGSDAANCGACGRTCGPASCAQGLCQAQAVTSSIATTMALCREGVVTTNQSTGQFLPTAMGCLGGDTYFAAAACVTCGFGIERVTCFASGSSPIICGTPTILGCETTGGTFCIHKPMAVRAGAVFFVNSCAWDPVTGRNQGHAIMTAGTAPVTCGQFSHLGSLVTTSRTIYAVAADATDLYWAEGDQVYRWNGLGGTSLGTVVSDTDLWVSSGHLYWAAMDGIHELALGVSGATPTLVVPGAQRKFTVDSSGIYYFPGTSSVLHRFASGVDQPLSDAAGLSPFQLTTDSTWVYALASNGRVYRMRK